MSKRNKTLELLRGLLGERQQYEQWLAALANKRADTPEAVYNRVHADYQSRLDGVLDKLQSHTADLQASMSELATQLGEVTERETSRREAQQEAELRAAVGEYTADRWSEMSRESETELRKLAQERGGIESQLAELSGILELTQGRTPTAANLIQPREVPAASPASSIGQESARPNTYAEAAAISAPPKPIEPPAKLEEVRQNTPAPPPAEAKADAVAETTVTRAKADLGDKAEQVKFPNWSESDKSQTQSNSAPPKSKTAPVRPEAEKTLKCSECGSMNFPTEWYCEKCGAELATL
jgi:hypothetical protein